jgi:lipoyl(octanoyl) transferase
VTFPSQPAECSIAELDIGFDQAYVWFDEARDGMSNMAIDETLAELAAETESVYLRFYRWQQPFVTLGYFQRADDLQKLALLRDLPFTRRTTGGGAIVHDRELTYSIVCPTSTSSKSASHELYCAVHQCIKAALKQLGHEVISFSDACDLDNATPTDLVPSREESFLCFERRSMVDLVLNDVDSGVRPKIVGSAQRRFDGSLLQHGSILLAESPSRPGLFGLLDSTMSDENSDNFAHILAVGIERLLGSRLRKGEPFQAIPVELTRGVLKKEDEKRHKKFQNSSWLFRK